MDQFEDLDEPLLEVIVHWLKGAGGVAPSWDAVVVTLRDPRVSEAELADKIHRLYSDHSKDEEARNRSDDQTYSGD